MWCGRVGSGSVGWDDYPKDKYRADLMVGFTINPQTYIVGHTIAPCSIAKSPRSEKVKAVLVCVMAWFVQHSIFWQIMHFFPQEKERQKVTLKWAFSKAHRSYI